MNVPAWIPSDRRTLALSAGAIALLVGAVVWALSAGGGGIDRTGASLPGSLQTPAPKPSPSGKPVAPSRATVRSRPPARLFAGSSSAPGVLVRVCDGGNCTSLPQGNPPTISSEAGRLITFSLADRPAQAWAEIRGLPGGAPSRQTLDPGNLMLWPSQVAPGRYLLTLNAKFEGSEARWVFELKVSR